MTKRISFQQLESYLWGAATLLRGTIDAGDYKQFIFPLLFYKRLCDVYDEETQVAIKESGGDAEFAAFPENHRFQIPAKAHWREVRQVAKDVGKGIQSAMRTIEKANQDKLFGIFGDAQWTNKDRLPDAMLRDLIEHFSKLELSLANLPEDELGNGYEYLIKKFADDSGHTAAEFYTNRTVVHLMTELLQPQPEESIYDPTCGSGGMLISCIAQLRRQGKEWRNVHLYGQERNLMTSSIARMNCFLHGIEGFRIERGDTLSEPKFVEGDRLQQFDLVLANPPYSIKQWDRAAFSKDPWGRNLYGTPPQGRADYAFWQHILCSLKEDTGRCAILFPHGVLFRQEEEEMRHKIIEADVIECIIGLGPNLFYNSPMEACIVICRMNKPPKRRGKILLINAVDEVTRERAQSFLTDEQIEHITGVYNCFKDIPGFSKVARLEEIRRHDWNLSIPLYVMAEKVNGSKEAQETDSLENAFGDWWKSRRELAEALKEILPGIKPPDLSGNVSFNVNAALVKDKNNWKRVKFGDVVENVNETENDPLAAGITRYIGLEHLEPGSLHVRTWGNVVDGTTFTRRCHPGQVLFGKRRAYQRKIAVAEFDAIVSGDIYVLEAKKGYLVQELLPFICSSDNFFKHAVGTSSGSLSPRTNWSSLAKFELNLPPLDQQTRIADILWAVDNLEKQYSTTKINFSSLLKARAFEIFPSIKDTHVPIRTLSDICIRQPQSGIYKGPKFLGKGIKMVNMGELFGNDIIDQSIPMERIELTTREIEKYSLTPNDLIFGRRSIVLEGAGKCSMIGHLDEPTIFESSILRVTIDVNKALLRFVFEWLKSPEGVREITKIRSFTTIAGITGTDLKHIRIPLPTISIQKKAVNELFSLRSQLLLVTKEVSLLTFLRLRLVESLLGE